MPNNKKQSKKFKVFSRKRAKMVTMKMSLIKVYFHQKILLNNLLHQVLIPIQNQKRLVIYEHLDKI